MLARQARVDPADRFGRGWLYGVAGRVARPARRDADRRRARERRGAEASTATRRRGRRRPGAPGPPELIEELGRLPERFRLPIVLCPPGGADLRAGRPQLGCPVRTVQSRLDRGRRRLRDRLARRGVGPSVASLAAPPSRTPGSGVVSESWKQATVRAAARYAAGGADGRHRLSHGRCPGRRSLESHDSPSADEMGAPVAGRPRRGRRGWRSLPGRHRHGPGMPPAAADGRYRVTMAGGAPRSRWSPSPRSRPAPTPGGARRLPARRGARRRDRAQTEPARRGGGPRDPGPCVRGEARRPVPVAPAAFRLLLGRAAQEGRPGGAGARILRGDLPPRSPDLRRPGEGRRRALEDRGVERRRRGRRPVRQRPQVQLRQGPPPRGSRPLDDGLLGRPQLLRAGPAPGRRRSRRQAAPRRFLLARARTATSDG